MGICWPRGRIPTGKVEHHMEVLCWLLFVFVTHRSPGNILSDVHEPALSSINEHARGSWNCVRLIITPDIDCCSQMMELVATDLSIPIKVQIKFSTVWQRSVI